MRNPIPLNADRIALVQKLCKWKPNADWLLVLADPEETEHRFGDKKLYLPSSFRAEVKPHVGVVFREDEKVGVSWIDKKVFFATGTEYMIKMEEGEYEFTIFAVPVHAIVMFEEEDDDKATDSSPV